MNFNIAGGSSHLYDDDIARQLGSIMNTSNYKKVIQDTHYEDFNHQDRVEKYFNSNFDYWNDIFEKNIFNGMKIRLSGFHILEWLPQFPGIIHKKESKDLIRMAYEYGNKKIIDDRVIEFDPDGKGMFMKAGYGSLRFGTKIVRGSEHFLLSATSTGESHEGIPLILSQSIYREVIRELNNSFGAFADIIGEVRLIPNSENPILNWRRIPSYYLFVKKLFIKRLSFEGETTVSIAISYSPNKENKRDYKWSFKQFYPDSRDENLFSSVKWLKDYAKRYGASDNPHLIGDFDEFIPHFSESDFELAKVTNNIISSETIQDYKTEYYLEADVIVEEDSGVFRIPSTKHQTIVSLLSENKIRECLDFLLNNMENEKVTNYVVITKSRFVRAEESNRRGTITMEEFDVYKTRIIDSLLNSFKKRN